MFNSRNKYTDPTRPVSAVQERGSKRKRQRRTSSLAVRPTHRAIQHTQRRAHAQPSREQSPAPTDGVPQPFSAKAVITTVVAFAAFVVVGALVVPNPPAIPEPSDGADEGPAFAEEDAGAWHKTVDGDELVATRLDSTSYSSCDEIETINGLTELGCEAAIKARYNAENGDILLDLFVMRMSNTAEAENAAPRMDSDDFTLENKESNAGNNQRQWGFAASEEFVIAVRTDARPQAGTELSDKYHEYFIADKAEEAAK